MSDVAYFLFKVFGDAFGMFDRSSPLQREARAYRRAYQVASERGSFDREILVAEFKAASVPGAYDDPDSGRLASVYHLWNDGVSPREFAKVRREQAVRDARVKRAEERRARALRRRQR